jgi:hypothetical protein
VESLTPRQAAERLTVKTILAPAAAGVEQGKGGRAAPAAEADERKPPESDGPCEPNGFRYRGAFVLFGRAALQYRLVLSLWDSMKSTPTSPRPAENVLSEVYGTNHRTSEGTFRQLCSDTRSKFEAANCPITIRNEQGKVWLVDRPA